MLNRHLRKPQQTPFHVKEERKGGRETDGQTNFSPNGSFSVNGKTLLAVRRHRWSPANHYVTLETRAGSNTAIPLQELEEEEEKAYPFR